MKKELIEAIRKLAEKIQTLEQENKEVRELRIRLKAQKELLKEKDYIIQSQKEWMRTRAQDLKKKGML